MGFIFAALAKGEFKIGMRGQAERSFGRAQCSYQAIVRLLHKVENEQRRSDVQTKTDQLGGELNLLKHEFNKAA